MIFLFYFKQIIRFILSTSFIFPIIVILFKIKEIKDKYKNLMKMHYISNYKLTKFMLKFYIRNNINLFRNEYEFIK